MKTMHVVLGIAAIGALVYWRNKNKTAAAVKANTAAATTTSAPIMTMPTKPMSEVSKPSYTVKLPSDLVLSTSGNTGIMPPIISDFATPIKVAQVPSKMTVLQIREQGLQGYCMN